MPEGLMPVKLYGVYGVAGARSKTIKGQFSDKRGYLRNRVRHPLRSYQLKPSH